MGQEAMKIENNWLPLSSLANGIGICIPSFWYWKYELSFVFKLFIAILHLLLDKTLPKEDSNLLSQIVTNFALLLY